MTHSSTDRLSMNFKKINTLKFFSWQVPDDDKNFFNYAEQIKILLSEIDIFILRACSINSRSVSESLGHSSY